MSPNIPLAKTSIGWSYNNNKQIIGGSTLVTHQLDQHCLGVLSYIGGEQASAWDEYNYIRASTRLYSGHSHHVVTTRVGSHNSCQRPANRNHPILSDHHDISDFQVVGRGAPLLELLQCCQILWRPTSPEVSDYGLAQLQSSKSEERLIGRGRVRESFKGPSY